MNEVPSDAEIQTFLGSFNNVPYYHRSNSRIYNICNYYYATHRFTDANNLEIGCIFLNFLKCGPYKQNVLQLSDKMLGKYYR